MMDMGILVIQLPIDYANVMSLTDRGYDEMWWEFLRPTDRLWDRGQLGRESASLMMFSHKFPVTIDSYSDIAIGSLGLDHIVAIVWD
ncbi:hypothetical protein RIF29_14439 [Crotalaria pallida]|uniref:Uncharacterized protein n=1 Tax=Crotalaria pallida TaxID=3830 RepID=A0AAN9FH28_CROPI